MSNHSVYFIESNKSTCHQRIKIYTHFIFYNTKFTTNMEHQEQDSNSIPTGSKISSETTYTQVMLSKLLEAILCHAKIVEDIQGVTSTVQNELLQNSTTESEEEKEFVEQILKNTFPEWHLVRYVPYNEDTDWDLENS